MASDRPSSLMMIDSPADPSVAESVNSEVGAGLSVSSDGQLEGNSVSEYRHLLRKKLTPDTVLDVRGACHQVGYRAMVAKTEHFMATHMDEMINGPLSRLPAMYVEVCGDFPRGAPFQRVLQQTVVELDNQGHTAVDLKRLPDRVLKVSLPAELDLSCDLSRGMSVDSGVDILESPILDRHTLQASASHAARRLFPDAFSDGESSCDDAVSSDEEDGLQRSWRVVGVCSVEGLSGTALVAIKDDLCLMHLSFGKHSESNKQLTSTTSTCSDQLRVQHIPSFQQGVCSASWLIDSRNQVYSIGGYDRNGFLNSMKTCVPGNDSWQTHQGRMAHPRAQAGAAILDDTIYMTGGCDGRRELYSAEKLCTCNSDRWCGIASLSAPRKGHSLCSVSGRLIAAGGSPDGRSAISTTEVYDPSQDAWTPASPLLHPRMEMGGASLNEKVYVSGGACGTWGYLDSVECYDPAMDRWSEMTPMSVRRRGLALAVLEGSLVAAGGYNGIHPLSTVERLDPRVGVWEELCELRHARLGLGLLPFACGQFLMVAGGYGSTSFVGGVEVYDARMNSWHIIQES